MPFLFGDYALDADRRELALRGEAVALEPQVFDLLGHLIHHRDQVVSKDDLLEAVWGGRIVSESTLTSRINAALEGEPAWARFFDEVRAFLRSQPRAPGAQG